MRVFIFLHIATMFAAVALAYAGQLLAYVAARRRDVRMLRGVTSATAATARFIGPTFAIGVIFGIVAIFTNDFDPLAPWLIIAYILTAFAFVWAAVITAPRGQQLGMTAAQNPSDDEFSPELDATVRNNFGLVIFVDILIVAALIADMVFKPLS